jgi:FixJ family two-component response regulator
VRAMDLGILGLLHRAESDVSSRTELGGLTSREREVAALLAPGMTNREIADGRRCCARAGNRRGRLHGATEREPVRGTIW